MKVFRVPIKTSPSWNNIADPEYTDMTDEGMCCGGQMAVQMPTTRAYSNAQAIWGVQNDIKYAGGTVYAPRADNVAFATYGNLGGLNKEVNPQPFYDPWTTTMRAPMEACPGELMSIPNLKHGPDAFTYTEADVAPRTQYAPQGELLAEPIVMDVSTRPCVCACVLMYSMTSLLMMPANLVKIRNAMILAGLVTATPQLLAQNTTNTCGCKILGGEEANVYTPYAVFAQQYTDVSIMQILEPAKEVLSLNQVYVSRVIGKAKSMVTSQAQMNYARAEGPRAQLQAYPQADCTPSTFSALLPSNLPFTGVPVVATDTLFATRSLTDPRSAVTNKEALSCLTGLPIGAAPVVRVTEAFCI